MQLNQNFSDFFDKPAAAPEASTTASGDVDKFVRQVAPAARRVADRLKVPVEAVIGQWGLETGWGKSVIPGTNNLGNIKGPGVAATDNMTGSRDTYRQYESIDKFADDFTSLLGSDRYRSVPGTRDANSYFAGLKGGGYAEDPAYVEKGARAASMVGDALKRIPAETKPVEDKFAGVPAWTDIQAKAEFQALTPAKQAEAKQAYFDYWIAPRVGQDADAIRQQFLGAAPAAPTTPAAAPTVDEQAGQAAFGVYPKAKTAKPKPTAGQLLEQPAPPAAPGTEPEFVSRVPVRPEVRRAFEAAWNAATPIERLQMEAAPGWTGQLARERAGYAKMRDEARAKASESMRTTLEAMDPRAEFRAARLRAQGEDPRFAERAGREGARRGALPGQEIKALDGTVQNSDFDFDTARYFDPKNPANGANNALVRGVTKGALGIGKAYAGLFQFQSDLVGFDAASKSAAKFGRSARGQEEAIGERGTFLERNFEGAVSSIAQQLPLLITGTAVASQAIPLAGMALQSFGQEYSDGRAKGQDTGQATIRASMFAAFEVIGERFGLGAQMDALRAAARGMPTSEIANLLFSALKKEIPGELVTTTGQFSVDKFAGSGIGLNPNATFGDYMKQVADTIAQTIMQSGMMGAGTTGVATGVRYLRDRGPNAAVAEADAEAAKRAALAKWAEFSRGSAPAQTTATQTVDGRIEPTIDFNNLPPAGGGSGPGAGTEPPFGDDSGPGTRTEPPLGDPLVQTADEIVRGMALDAGLPEGTVLPGNVPPPGLPTQSDQDILDFAGTRFQQLRDKQGTPDEPGPGLTEGEAKEFQALVQARGNPGRLRAFYGLDQPGEADVRQTQEPLDGSPSSPAAGTQGQAAAAQVPEQPGQQPNEDGQAQGLGQAIDGLGALFGQETEAEREARLEREAIQGESEMQGAGQQADDDIPFDLPPPRTEKEARERKEQQANVQAGQAQQTQAPSEEALRTPAAPPAAAGGAEGGVGAPGNQPRIGDAFDATGWTEQENKVNKKTGQPVLSEGRVRYKRTDERGFEQTVVVQNGKVTTSSSVSPVIELTNSYLDDEAPVRGRVHVGNSDVQGLTLAFLPEDSSNAVPTKMSPRAVQEYKAGVPIEKIAETEFSDAGGINPDGTRTPHTTVGKLAATAPKPKTEREAREQRQQEAVTRRENAPDGMQVHVFRTNDGFGTGLYDDDAGEYVNGSVTRFTGQDAEAKANAKADEVLKKATPANEAPSVRIAGGEPQFKPSDVLNGLIDAMNGVDRVADKDLRNALEERGLANAQGLKFAGQDFLQSLQSAEDPQALVDKVVGKRPFPKQPKPKTEKEARQQRLADKPLPGWTQKAQNFPANTTFAWEQNGDNVVLVAKVGDKEFGRVAEDEAKTGASFGTMRLQKALLDESMRQAGVDSNLNWTPAGGDTSVEDRKQRQDEKTEKRSRASRELDEAIKKADAAGATATKSKLVDLRMAFDRKDKGPGQVLKALESVDSDIEKEQAQGGTTSPEGAGGSQPTPAAPKTEAEAKQQRKAQFQDALDQEYNNGFESNNPASNPVLRSKQDLETDYGPLTDQQVDQLRAAYAQGQAEGDASEGAAATKPAPTPDAPAAPDLKGIKVKFDVLVEDTGQTASMTVDAAAQMKEYDEREKVLRELIACLQK